MVAKYLVRLDPGGRIVVIKSDGAECTPEERQWVHDAIVARLRSVHLHPHETQGIITGEGRRGITRGGVSFEIDPMVDELEQRRADLGLHKTTVAALSGIALHRIYDWLSGKSRPHLSDIRELGAVLNLVPVLIPAGILRNVLRMKELYYNHGVTGEVNPPATEIQPR
jgi:hypothetical protein